MGWVHNDIVTAFKFLSHPVGFDEIIQANQEQIIDNEEFFGENRLFIIIWNEINFQKII